MPATDLRDEIRAALAAYASTPHREAATALLGVLGYGSPRTLSLGNSEPAAFLNFVQANAKDHAFDEAKALVKDWKSADLLFQLTDEELSENGSLFQASDVAPGLLRSYVFFAIELRGAQHARAKLTGIARQLNRVFPMPVMLLLKHQSAGKPVLSIAVINRRQNKRDADKDVLGKVTIIRDIVFTEPHRGHLEILASFARPNLVHPERLAITNFDALHAAWEQIFNVDLLNERFYRELANWYFWALPQVAFPNDTNEDEGKLRATSLIRLLTRLIFCWFLKEKGLIPRALFEELEVRKILEDLSKDSSSYYLGVLQNLFFATLNQRMGTEHRAFAPDEGFQRNRSTHGVDTLYRYESLFREPDSALSHFADVPFLNGGLFECLDREDESGKRVYLDGFTRNEKKRPSVPNELFFGEERTVDLSEQFEEGRRRNEKTRGLLRILHSYKFTIVENTPIDQEIALDPELLGKVFENLLASYNEETKTTARNQTGSFYTPRALVDYMVDESLKAHLTRALVASGMAREDAQVGLEILFAYTEREHPFVGKEADTLLAAIHGCKILDPACGSGAFPMGALQKLVYIIHKLDPDNQKWMRLQVEAAQQIPDSSARELAIKAIEQDFASNEDDYGRKLYLIENCLYGTDIQPIAIQISKLRFFISLVADQRTSRDKSANHGVRPLPNLETKFVAADTLIGLPQRDTLELLPPRVYAVEAEIESLYHRHFAVQRRDQKLGLQKRVRELRGELAQLLAASLGSSRKARHVAEWDPFNPQVSSDFFDPRWMFGKTLAEGFDVVIGNPPYRQIQKYDQAQKALWSAQAFATYEAMGDIYCLFYERGAQLLRPGGILCYITQNKWMRADYGESLRKFLATQVNTETVFDFGMAQNFGAATTYTCITRFSNETPAGALESCYAADDVSAMADPKGYFAANAVQLTPTAGDPWVVLTPERQRIKAIVEAQGVPLSQWDVRISRGVLTGFNEAFYITQEQRDAFVAEDSRCANYLVRLLRGRDVSRYEVDWPGSWMIATFPALQIGLNELPVPIRRHLTRFREQLEPKPRGWTGGKWPGRKAGSYKWYETQDVIAYHSDFAAPKVLYPNMTSVLPFYLDVSEGYFVNDKAFILLSETESMAFLTAVLNSSLFRCCFRDNFPELQGNAYEVRKTFVEKIPLKKPSTTQRRLFERLVAQIQQARRESLQSAAVLLEELTDAAVMEVYFRAHMAERDLLFIDELLSATGDYNPSASREAQRAEIESLFAKLSAPDSLLRNRLLRLTTSSPDLLAVIKAEGTV